MPNLWAVPLLFRALNALLPLAALALWLAPQVTPVEAAATVHAARHATPAAHGAPAAALDALAEVEVERRLDPPSTAVPTVDDRPISRVSVTTPDPTALARTRGPIYRVRRSGQAHRSAP